MPLDPASIGALLPKAVTYKITDGEGLYLEIRPNGARYWRFRYRWAGKPNTFSCGVYPETGLVEARARRNEARKLLDDGIDPSQHAKDERAKTRDEQARQKAATRFMLDSDGALSFRLGSRSLSLTPAETGELRGFLDATRGVTAKR